MTLVKKSLFSLVSIGVGFFSFEAMSASAVQTYPTYFAASDNFVTGVCADPAFAASQTGLNLLMGKLNGVRFDVAWKYVETKKGVYTIPAAWDNEVNALVSKGIQPLLILDYGNPLYRIQRPTTPAEIQAFTNYALAVVHHFRERVKYFEIWNEWDQMTGTTLPAGDWGKPQDYINLIKVAYPALKAVASQSTFIVGTLGAPGLTYGDFDSLLSLGLLKYGDAVGIHPYVYSNVDHLPEDAVALAQTSVRKVVAANGGKNFPVFITEVGWSTQISDNRGAGGTEYSESDQGNYLARTLLQLRTIGVSGVWFYSLQEGGTNPSYNEDHFGIVRTNAMPKQAYQSVIDLSSSINHASAVEWSRLNNNGDVYFMTLKMPGNSNQFAVWSTGNKMNGALNGTHYTASALCKSTSTVLTITTIGTGETWTTSCSALTLTLGTRPFLIQGDLTGLNLTN